MGNERTTLCWGIDINWARFEDILDSMEGFRPSSRTESSSEVDPTEPGIAGWPGLPNSDKPGRSSHGVAFYDPACDTIGSKTRPGNSTNKISGV